MDFHLKQCKDQRHESDPPSAKLPRLGPDEQQPPSASSSHALPWAVPELTSKLSNLSAFLPDSTPLATRFARMGSYFSLSQWQELELQALIFRHMLAGLAVPPELLHLLNKTVLNTSPYYVHPYPHYQPALLQSGYWGRGGMDPEPGRCRRTDGKKWRCSRDVVAGHKYCERHMHRGRNRSRKPVENPTSTVAGAAAGSGGELLKNPLATVAGGTHLALSGPSPSIDLLHLSQRSSELKTENRYPFEPQHEASEDSKPGDCVLRHFFDDWPRSLKEPANSNVRSPVASATSLSISMPGNSSSDVSLKLSTGNKGEPGMPQYSSNPEQGRTHFNWSAGWAASQVASMGGPLAEALRSSVSNSSPTSVLRRRSSTSDTSYVST